MSLVARSMRRRNVLDDHGFAIILLVNQSWATDCISGIRSPELNDVELAFFSGGRVLADIEHISCELLSRPVSNSDASFHPVYKAKVDEFLNWLCLRIR